MSKFKVGERVKCIRGANSDYLQKGKSYEVKDIVSVDSISIINPGYSTWENGWDADRFIKIGGSMQSVSKYDELKDRIEANRTAELGWGKEFDDILSEIGATTSSSYYIRMPIHTRTYVAVFDFSENHLCSYLFSNQCSKNTALHDAALWLLNNSDIKKDEKGDKIKHLEECLAGAKKTYESSIDTIQRQIRELK